MQVTIGFCLTEEDMKALKNSANGNVSEKIRDIISKATAESIAPKAHTKRTACRIDLEVANKLQELANTAGVLPAQALRAAVERYLEDKGSNDRVGVVQ